MTNKPDDLDTNNNNQAEDKKKPTEKSISEKHSKLQHNWLEAIKAKVFYAFDVATLNADAFSETIACLEFDDYFAASKFIKENNYHHLVIIQGEELNRQHWFKIHAYKRYLNEQSVKHKNKK